MVDGIQINDLKCVIPDTIDLQVRVNTSTGETAQKQTAIHRGSHIALYPNGRVRFSGSLTTYINGDNTINLTFNQVCTAIDELCKEFTINPETTILNGLEIGLNVPTTFNPDEFLKNLLSWNRIEPLKWIGKKEFYVQFKQSRLTFKIYSKSKQYGLSGNLLRLEIRIDKMEFAHKFGVRTLSDLKDKKKIESLLNVLIESFNDLIYYDDSIDLKELKKADITLLEKGNNPRYWSLSDLNRSTLNRNKKRFQNLVNEYGKNGFQNIAKSLVSEKYSVLKICNVRTDFSNHAENQNLQRSDSLNSVSIPKCEVTNYPKVISNKRGRFLSSLDVEFYYKYDTNIYNDLVERFNTRTYKNIDYTKESLEKRFEEITHRIRAVDFNKRNNDRNNTRRAIDKLNSTPSLFNNMALISDHKKQIAGIY
ncbi:hypothetical protein [Plebeiibacterium sediminum]|uniref:Uncharacterized protein n=1 Tax=Plebeiibacterium sediminum TaxID=2992112 RepID=A0AAE3SET9_9BACT|nr:hypothetical protein [Plebeiobacterium sediminum]MCW3786838.1 hypothetical protein [Plebeiobacterium sediminum]